MAIWMGFIVVTLLSCLAVSTTESARVLVLLPFSSKSHLNAFTPIIEELARRNHDVTFVTVFEPTSTIAKSPRVKCYVMHEARAYFEEMMALSSNMTTFTINVIFEMGPLMQESCRRALNDTNFKKFMKEPGTYDVVLVSALMNHCYLAFTATFKAPIVLVSPSTLMSNVAWDLGVPFPFSYVPLPLVPFHSPMTFVQRCLNVFAAHMWQLFDLYYFDRLSHQVVLEYLPDAPLSNEIARSAAMVFVNSHVSLQESRPSMPYVIDVGGMQCKPGKPVPKEFQTFIDGSGDDGFVLFSMGSVVQGQFLPVETIDKLKNVFSRLKQRVIWKFEKQLDGLSNNTMISSWLPQQDIIAHPKCKLAMTHGGLFSLQEVAYHGVPLLGFPQGVDRDNNLQTAIRKGFAEILDLKTATEDEMVDTINRMIQDKTYSDRAKEISSIMKDRPLTPVETAAYWVEYVIRHKGALHLRSGADQLNLFQYLLLDVYATFGVIIILVIFVPLLVARWLWRRCRARRANQKNKQKTN